MEGGRVAARIAPDAEMGIQSRVIVLLDEADWPTRERTCARANIAPLFFILVRVQSMGMSAYSCLRFRLGDPFKMDRVFIESWGAHRFRGDAHYRTRRKIRDIASAHIRRRAS